MIRNGAYFIGLFNQGAQLFAEAVIESCLLGLAKFQGGRPAKGVNGGPKDLCGAGCPTLVWEPRGNSGENLFGQGVYRRWGPGRNTG